MPVADVAIMPARFYRLQLALLPTCLTLGCDHHAFSPPARALPLETVAPLSAGATGIQLEGGGHEEAAWGPSLVSGTARVRHGVGEDTDLSVEATVLHVMGQSTAGTNPDAGMARVGVKHRVLPFLSLTAGVGGGGSAGGGFVSPDIGAIVAYENPYVVPFFAMRGTLSQPIAARPINTTGVGDTMTYINTPELTWIYGGTVGLRIPLWPHERVSGSLIGGVGITMLNDRVEDAGYVSASGGAEVVF